jgi:predicted RNase H-like nuclease (RuvC/YqgF family)
MSALPKAEGTHLRLHVDAADGISRVLNEQEETIRRLATENARLKGQVEMLDRANEMLAASRDKETRRADLWQGACRGLSRKLAEYHQGKERDAHDGDSLADQIDMHRSNQ